MAKYRKFHFVAKTNVKKVRSGQSEVPSEPQRRRMIISCALFTLKKNTFSPLVSAQPRYTGCRISPELVHSVNFTSATSDRSIHVVAASSLTLPGRET